MSQSVEDLKARRKAMNDIFEKLLDKWAGLTETTKSQLTTGINKSYGQAISFHHEYKLARAAEKKGREIITQQHADVTVGAADNLFAKSIEAKSVTAPTKGDANNLIKKAFEQLGGGTGFLPRPGDVRVLDLKIEGDNPWPNVGGGYGVPRNAISMEDIASLAQAEIWDLLTNVTAGAGTKALVTWLDGRDNIGHRLKQIRLASSALETDNSLDRLLDPQLAPSTAPNPHSSRKVIVALGVPHALRCLTIKIRYAKSYVTYKALDKDSPIHLDELVFQVYRHLQQDKASIELAKMKYKVFDRDEDLPRPIREFVPARHF
ncbi:hypothetical protein EJP67_28880 [Variovorax guangxiensis]|uniref:Uncharacterized protein n=1 Tax=Variovorax guangxiensis TaxID=1775474 RepID=A0A3S0XW57_9BURK|nr:hypothetical protein [Variovorax guangxiensis]RUR71076.1 hypothetical protein EJP67_28880 [Variovorax guangxiensis]